MRGPPPVAHRVDGAHLESPPHCAARRHGCPCIITIGFAEGLCDTATEGLTLVQQLEDTFSVGLGPHKRYTHHREVVERVTHAITDKKRIRMRYDSASRGRVTRREVDVSGMPPAASISSGYCHLRKEPRMFAVERIKSITPTDLPYQIPPAF